MTPSRVDAHSLLRRWYAEGVAAVEPGRAVRQHLHVSRSCLHVGTSSLTIPEAGVIIVAIGKAAVAMSRGASDVLGKRIRNGIILTKDGHAQNPPAGLRVFEAAHPIPDERGTLATTAILDLVADLGNDDIVLTLISGGGSALFEAPRHLLTLADLQVTTELLLRAGAPIQDLNAVRSPLSLVKGGGVRERMGPAKCVSLILSDVPGNDPAVIASGPTIPMKRNPSRALDILEHYGVLDQVPRRVVEFLDRETDDPRRETPEQSDDVFQIVADNDMFVDWIAGEADDSGFHASVTWRRYEGEARELGRRFVEELQTVSASVCAVLGGGEATVTVRGDGIGGRNTEFAMSAAIELDRTGADWVVASLASDGQDGLVDAAGAIADRTTLTRASRIGLDAQAFLERNDTGPFFKRLGDLVAPGPTGTNVNDVYIAVRTQPDPM